MPESVYPALPPPRASVSQGSSKPRSLVSRDSRTSLASRGSFRKESRYVYDYKGHVPRSVEKYNWKDR